MMFGLVDVVVTATGFPRGLGAIGGGLGFEDKAALVRAGGVGVLLGESSAAFSPVTTHCTSTISKLCTS